MGISMVVRLHGYFGMTQGGFAAHKASHTDLSIFILDAKPAHASLFDGLVIKITSNDLSSIRSWEMHPYEMSMHM